MCKKLKNSKADITRKESKLEEVMEYILMKLELNYISDISLEVNRQRVLQFLDYIDLEINDKDSYEKIMHYLEMSSKSREMT